MSATPARWTFFVPLTGLDLDQSANLTEPPLFGDATIVSGASIAHIFESDDRQAHHSAGAFIAVQRRAAIAGTAPYFDAYKVNRNFVATARARVREIAALMAVVVVASTNEGRVVGVPEQHQYQDEHYRMYCVDDGQAIEVTGHGLATDTFINGYELDTWRLSRTEVEVLLTHPGYAALVRLFGQPTKGARTPLRRTVMDATSQLAAAIHGGSYVNQLLSAVISLDILFSTDAGTSFEQKKRRLRTLIGDEIYERYQGTAILQARHKYVHEGQEVAQRAYPLQAIGLATYALCRYAALTDHFTSKTSLLSCLDLARTAPEIHDPWMVALGHDVQTLLAPAQAVPAPALFAYIDRALTFDEELESGLYDRDS